ncbi:MAG: hypothetical protein ILP10_00310 [Lachnospiraceae bacterium]|nr:hypothetical protein [Lachnospiraceae bacterium]
MSITQLKIIAAVTMLIDHLTACCMIPEGPLYNVGRVIGRIAFPIFAFAIVEGYVHTRNLRNYFLRLAALAVVSEVLFDLLRSGQISVILGLPFGLKSGFYGFTPVNTSFLFAGQNTVFTMILGLAAVALIDKARRSFMDRPGIYNMVGVVIIVGLGLLAEVANCDYSGLGVLLILVFYFFRNNKVMITISFAVWIVVFCSFGSYREIASAVALIPIFLYDATKGSRGGKVFYFYYPAHLLLVVLVRSFIV